MKRRAWNSTLPAPTKPIARGKGLKRGGRLKAKPKGRTEEQKAYIELFPRCELCELLDDWHWLEFRSRDFRRCIGAAMHCHHVWRPPRWDEGHGNLVTCCPTSHDYVHRYARYGVLVCTWAKIANGTFDRETVRAGWGRDPIDAIHADIDGGLMGVPESVYEELWTLVRESF